VRRIVEVALARFGFIDSVVNAAADTKFHGKLTELWDADEYAPSQLFANCVAPLRLVSLVHRACWRDRTAANAERNRSVVNVSSVSGLYVFRDSGQAFYAASKAALNILTMYLALELAPYSVRANALCPGRFTEGDSTEQVATNVIRLLEGTDTGMVTRGIVAERRLSRSGPRRGKTASE
jgi:NAD(P)-dependent dehydrogenase (short-subunit alcohol dehydrogenase family)